MNQIVANFQFIRPEYFFVLIPLFLGYVLKLKFAQHANIWQNLLPNHLYQNMVIKKGVYQSNKFVHVLMVAMVISTIALAGPTWEKLPQTVYQSQAGKVVLLDMSMSMRATDLTPDRLTRAKFKALDLIDEVKEGETGVIAYAGDAFVISPLTDDIGNLKTLIPSLSPDIMPIQGSYALYGLQRSEELLINAGYQSGQIYWFTDGIQYEEVQDIRDFINTSNFEVSALLVGTEAGAPISMTDGQLLKDRTGKIVIPSINERYMNQAMQGTKGSYQLFTPDNSDIKGIKRKIEFEQKQASEVQDASSDMFRDMGPYLVILLLPIAAYAFRKGILSVVLTMGLLVSMGHSNPALAQTKLNVESPDNEFGSSASAQVSANSLVSKLFKNPDQRGKLAFDNQNYQHATELFKDKEWQAASAYKMAEYEKAELIYNELEGIENLYNKANAQAKQGKLLEALESYEQVLENEPRHKRALKNKAIVEELLEQQSDQEQSNQEPSQDQQSPQEQEQSNNQNDSSQQNSPQQEQDSQDQSAQQKNQSNDQQSSQQNSNQPQDSQMQQDPSQNSEQNDEQLDDPRNNKQQTAGQEQPSMDSDEQKSAISNQIDMDKLTPEQKEELQRMQMIMNKVPDDPAFLLKRKMLLEAQRRQRTPLAPTQQTW